MLLSCTKEENGPYAAKSAGQFVPRYTHYGEPGGRITNLRSIPWRKLQVPLHSKPCKFLEHPFGGRGELGHIDGRIGPIAIEDTFV
jgi:hypothetical protein